MNKNGMDIFFEDIEIPDIVQKKAQEAFLKIHLEKEGDNMEEMKNNRHKNKHYFWQKKAAAIVLAALVGGGSITALARVYMNWSHGMQAQMNVSNEQMLELQDTEGTLVSFPAVSDTRGDITVSAAQCLLDDNNIKVALYVEGYELESSIKPKLDNLSILLDGQPVYNYEWYFYSGIDFDDKGNPVMADGSEALMDAEGGIIPNYQIDGKMEIDINLSPVDENGKAVTDLAGKVITIQMDNFGENTGTWTLEWALESGSEAVEVELNEVLGNSGATVTKVELSPISAKIYYDFPMTEIQDMVLDENGSTIESTDFAEPPEFVGIKMTDGTVYTGILNGGTYSYEDMDSSIFIAKISLSRVINPEEVQSLLFLRDDIMIEGENEITENDCYVVDVK